MMKKKMNKTAGILLALILASFGQQVFAAEGKTAISIYNKAVELQNDENWYLASQYFMEVVDINPAFSDAWFRLADCSFRLGEYDLAYQFLESAEKYEKNNSSIQNLKGMILLALGKTNDAKAIFTEILKKFPNDVDAHFGLAEIELYDGKFSGAENQYLEALKRQGSNRKALLSLALVYAETNRFSEAIKYLNQAMRYYSGEAEVHYLSAIVYLMKGDYKLAEKHARIAVEIKGNYEKGYELLSTILYLQNRYSEVIDLCDYLISNNRKNSQAWYLKGIAQDKLGNSDEAIETWDSGLSIQPQDEIMRTILELNARSLLELSDSRRSEWANYHVANGKQYDTRYDKAGSTYEYQRALLMDPKNETARLAYANIL